MTKARFVMSVDGGGARSTAALWTSDGHLLTRSRNAPCLFSYDPEGAIQIVRALWTEMCPVVGLDKSAGRQDASISIASGALGQAQVRARMFEAFDEFRAISLSSHGYAALIGAFGGGPGAVLLCEDEISACSFGHDHNYRALGGWQAPWASRGSAAWIGQQMIADYLQSRDGLAPFKDSLLWSEVESRIGQGREPVLQWIQSARPQDFASFAPAIVEAEQSGDAEAIDLITAACDEIRKMITVIRGDPPLPFEIAGSLGRILRPYLDLPQSSARPSLHRGAFLIGNGEIAPEFFNQK